MARRRSSPEHPKSSSRGTQLSVSADQLGPPICVITSVPRAHSIRAQGIPPVRGDDDRIYFIPTCRQRSRREQCSRSAPPSSEKSHSALIVARVIIIV